MIRYKRTSGGGGAVSLQKNKSITQKFDYSRLQVQTKEGFAFHSTGIQGVHLFSAALDGLPPRWKA